MKRSILWLSLLLFALPAIARQMDLYDGHVSLQLPAGFRPMTPEEIARKYPRAQPPQFAFTDGDQLSQSIAISRIRFPVDNPPSLSDLGSQMQQRIAIQSGITVHRHGPVDVGPTRWYAIDFRSTAVDQPVENLLRVTMAGGYIVILTANAVSRAFADEEASLRAVLDSVTLR